MKNFSEKTFSSISELTELRNKYLNNPVMGYLNINSLRNKLIDLREIMTKAPLDIVCIDETQLAESFPNFQFNMENYQFPPFGRYSERFQVVNKYENIFLAGDLNIDLLDSKSDPDIHFSVLREIYDLTNLVKVPTCYKNLNGTLLDVLLTNKPNNFQQTIVCETGLSDYHMLIATTLRSTFIKLPPKTAKYRSYKNFSETVFFMN